VEPAKNHQILEVGWAAFGPVDDVMAVGPSGPTAAGEPTAPIPVVELTSQPSGDRPGSPSNTDGLIVNVYRSFDNGVTGEPSCGLVGQQRAGFRFDNTTLDSDQSIQIGVHSHLRRSRSVVAGRGTKLHQPIGQAGGIWVEHAGLRVHGALVRPLSDSGLDNIHLGTGKRRGQTALHTIQRSLNVNRTTLPHGSLSSLCRWVSAMGRPVQRCVGQPPRLIR
jgi:hypothetical protein